MVFESRVLAYILYHAQDISLRLLPLPKCECLSWPVSMSIDKQWECWTLCAIKTTARTYYYVTSKEVNEASRPNTCNRPCAFEETKRNKKNEIPPHPKHTCLKMHIFSSRSPLWRSKAAATRIANMSDMPIVQPTEDPRTSPPGSRGSEHMPLYISCVHLPECSVSRTTAAGALEA